MKRPLNPIDRRWRTTLLKIVPYVSKYAKPALLSVVAAILVFATVPTSATSTSPTNIVETGAVLAASENPPNSQIDSALRDGKLVFLYFYSKTCPYGQKQEPIIGELEDEFGQSVTFIEIDGQRNRKAMDEFGVTGFPTMILMYGRDSWEQDKYDRFEGFTDKATLVSALAKVIGAQSSDSTTGAQSSTMDDLSFQKVPDGAQYRDSYQISPLSSALHVLPPLGKNNEKTTQADQALADFLLVTICRINGDECTPVYEFTSQKMNKGLDYIKLQNKFYHVNWNISKADSGKTFEIHFIVAGLDIGDVTYVPQNGETIPIKFHIDNHPRIRARVLHEQGYSAIEIAQALIEEFNLCAYDIAQVLYFENFTGIEVGEILRDLFGLDATAAAQILKDIGFSVVEIALMLKNVFGLAALEGAQLLLALGFGPAEITLALRDAFELEAYDAGLVLKELSFNEYTIQSMLIEVYNVYAVIVDIKSTVNNDPNEPDPLGYTGLAFCREETRCTEPYIPGLFGQFVTPEDINAGIGGDDRFVYVKYELVSKTSDQPVVTGIKAAHWPYWDEPFPCGAGWTPVSRLTTGTESSCWRNGMCAQYQPFKDAEKFVTNPAISYGDYGNPATKCSAVCESNSNIWPLYTDSLDIHSGCEDEHWVFFCYNQAQAWPARPVTIEVSDNEKLALLEQYAPRVFFAPELPLVHPAERFYPSSVEWSFDHLFRYSPDDLPPFIPPYPMLYHLFPQPDNKYYVSPKEMISSPSDWLEYHRGCNGSATDNPCQLSDAPAYAFWNKQTNNPMGWGRD